jgi:phage-related protein
MSAENDLAMAYHMGYEDALAKRLPDASKTQALAPYDLKAENATLRELVKDMCVWAYIDSDCDLEDRFANRMKELGVEVDG